MAMPPELNKAATPNEETIRTRQKREKLKSNEKGRS